MNFKRFPAPQIQVKWDVSKQSQLSRLYYNALSHYMSLKEDKDIETGENYVKSKKSTWTIFFKGKEENSFLQQEFIEWLLYVRL